MERQVLLFKLLNPREYLMLQKLLCCSACLTFFFATNGAAQDNGLILTLGRLTTNSFGARQVLSLKNTTSKGLARVEIECGFYSGEKLVGNGSAYISDLDAGSLAHDDVVAVDAGDADNVKCRIKSQR